MNFEAQGRNQYRLRSTPLAQRDPKPFHPGLAIVDRNAYLQIPAFSATVLSWLGSSYQVARTIINLGTPWAVAMPATRPTGFNACAVVRWMVGADSVSYKLWKDVGEKLHYPLYDGTPLPATDLHLEFWSIEDGLTTMTLANVWNLRLTGLIFPDPFYQYTPDVIAVGDAVCKTHATTPSTLDDYFSVCP